MSIVEKRLHITAPLDKVWDALTDPEQIDDWMMDEVLVDLRVGGAYAFFGGETTGQFTRVDAPHTLEYTWRQSSWPADWPDSLVRWSLRGNNQGADIHLTHSNFPNDDERDSHDEGWDTYWLGPMQEWLESGI